VQGAVLTSFNLAISQDVRLGSTFIKQSTAKANPLSSFRFAMLLAAMRVKRLEKSVSDMICKRLASAMEDETRRRDPRLAWATPEAPQGVGKSELHSVVESRNLLRVVEWSANGGTWDLILPSLVTLGLAIAKAHNSYSPDSSIHTDVDVPPSAVRPATDADAEATAATVATSSRYVWCNSYPNQCSSPTN
jgi:hypothetical protein